MKQTAVEWLLEHGYWWNANKNTLGVRYRTQIYKQIIERFKLNDYLK